MGKILVIAEKPSVASDIAKVLKCKSKGEGFLYNDEYIVSWAIGHLVTLYDPEDYDAMLKKWSENTLPILPDTIKLKPINKTKTQLNVLKKLMNSKDTDSIICATDSGREGELIFRYIYEIVKCKKSFKRLWISSMTDTAIKEGFKKLKDSREYDNLYLSAKCRSEADWLVGINATRAFTVKHNALLSIGRVQTPTLSMIVERQKEIRDFVPEEYFEVEADYGEFKGIWFKQPFENETRINKKSDAEIIANNVKGEIANIYDVKREEKRQSHPLLFDLTELQRECNRKFGFSAKKTLDVAQSLYEKRKMITYPRTDSRYLSADMKSEMGIVLSKIKDTGFYSEFLEYAENNIKNSYTKRVFDNSKVSDHHAIIPSKGKLSIDKLTTDEKKVFDIIVLRFISVFYPQYIYNSIKVFAKCKNENFISKGTEIVEKGWTVLYEKFKTKKDEPVIPDVKIGDNFVIKKSAVIEKKTMPPKNYTEATILSAMENAGKMVEDEELKEKLKESGIGTPATRAAIIERLISVGYVIRQGKNLIPTEKGENLIAIVPEELKSPETTGKWEKGLSSVAKGKMSQERFMGSIERYVRFLVDNASASNTDIKFEKEEYTKNKKAKRIVSIGKCPLCGKKVLENTKAFYCESWKSGCKFTIWKNSLEIYGIDIDKTKMRKLLKDKELKNVVMHIPQTGEKGKGTVILTKKDESIRLEIKDFIRD